MESFDKIFKKQSMSGSIESKRADHNGNIPFKQIITKKDVKAAVDVIRRLVGKDIEALPFAETGKGKLTCFLVLDKNTEDVYRVAPDEGEWTVLLMKDKGIESIRQKGAIRTIWTTRRTPACESAKKLLEIVLEDSEVDPLNLQFFCEAVDFETDIHRKSYNSSVGLIWLHTRRAPGGTKCCIEITKMQTKKCINFLHTKDGEMTEREVSDCPPF